MAIGSRDNFFTNLPETINFDPMSDTWLTRRLNFKKNIRKAFEVFYNLRIPFFFFQVVSINYRCSLNALGPIMLNPASNLKLQMKSRALKYYMECTVPRIITAALSIICYFFNGKYLLIGDLPLKIIKQLIDIAVFLNNYSTSANILQLSQSNTKSV